MRESDAELARQHLPIRRTKPSLQAVRLDAGLGQPSQSTACREDAQHLWQRSIPDAPGSTPWQGFVGPGTAFEPENAGLKLKDDFPDGLSNTILFVEAQQQVPWSKPADISYGPGISLPPLGQDYLQRGEWPFRCPVRGEPRFMCAWPTVPCACCRPTFPRMCYEL